MFPRAEGAAVAPTANDTRDDSTLVAVVHKNQLVDGKVQDGIHPGLVSLGWLALGDNAENWVEVPDTDTGPAGDPTAGSIGDVLGRVERGEVSAADALAAEQAKGDKARSTLVDQLTSLAAAGQEG
jgi:hypothetical protein